MAKIELGGVINMTNAVSGLLQVVLGVPWYFSEPAVEKARQRVDFELRQTGIATRNFVGWWEGEMIRDWQR
ncbi:MAG: hypothetical protein WC841_04685 [Candidatus Shapirobacteria bacterium]